MTDVWWASVAGFGLGVAVAFLVLGHTFDLGGGPGPVFAKLSLFFSMVAVVVVVLRALRPEPPS